MRKAKGKTEPVGTVASGAVPAEALEQSFPSIRLPIHPPYPPAEAKSVAEIPSGEGWLYEPKWDGFRTAYEVDKVLFTREFKAD